MNVYIVTTEDGTGYFASRAGARRYLEPMFRKHWDEAQDPAGARYGFLWAERYREVGERAARNSFMAANIRRRELWP